MNLEAKTVFVLVPHIDDAEFGCGGTIARLVDNKAEVYTLVFSGEDERKEEMKKASSILGIKKNFIFNLQIRNLWKSRQGILDKLISLKKQYNPDLVLLPCLNDIHQDHQVISMEGVRAFKGTNLWGYEVSANNLTTDFQLFIRLTVDQLKKKIEAIRCYKSQNHRGYADDAFIYGLAKVRGTQVGTDYAEAFSVIREVL